MASAQTVKTVENLLGHFDNNLVDQFQSFLSIALDKKSMSVAQSHDVVSRHLYDIVDAMHHGAPTAFIKQPMILRLFSKFHQMILSMPDPSTASNLKKAGKIKRDNDVKWKMICDLIEQLLSYLHQHDLMPSAFVWTDLIRDRLLLQSTTNHIDSARNAILLCRILLVLGDDLFRDHRDQFLRNECTQFLVHFLIDFVPRDFKKYDEYNDLHTMQDMEDALKLIARYTDGTDHKTEQQRIYPHDSKLDASSSTVYSASVGSDGSKLEKPNDSMDDTMNGTDGPQWERKEVSNGLNDGNGMKRDTVTESVHRADDALHRQIVSHYATTRVKGKERAQKEALIAHIGRCWKKVLVSSTGSSRHSRVNRKKLQRLNGRKYVGLFGSTACKLDSTGSDIDLYVTVPPGMSLSTAGEWSVFKFLSQELNRKGNGYPNRLKVINIFHCTVPIIKMVDAVHRIDADLSFGKQWENGQIVKLINMFCDHRGDDTVRQFIVAIKYWANRRGLNDAQSNRLNSFGWVLMAIRYLQSVHVLPRIRRCGPEKEEFEFVRVDLAKRFSLGKAMRGFFSFWAEWDYDSLSISLYKEVVRKRKRRYYDLSGWELKETKLVFVIEDPVQSDYNCSKNVRKFTANLMRIEFYRSLMILNYGDGDFNCLCRSVR